MQFLPRLNLNFNKLKITKQLKTKKSFNVIDSNNYEGQTNTYKDNSKNFFGTNPSALTILSSIFFYRLTTWQFDSWQSW